MKNKLLIAIVGTGILISIVLVGNEINHETNEVRNIIKMEKTDDLKSICCILLCRKYEDKLIDCSDGCTVDSGKPYCFCGKEDGTYSLLDKWKYNLSCTTKEIPLWETKHKLYAEVRT